MTVLKWILSIIAAGILVQTLYFKFTAAPESVYIFETVGMEPYGRIGSGIAELIASVLLLIPATRVYGALMAAAVISGAIFFHLTKLGIEVQGDGGLLFYLALAVMACAVFLILIDRKVLLAYVQKKS